MDIPLDSSICPYLGRCDDPHSFYAFPTDGNCCHSEQRSVPIDRSYQTSTCLAESWVTCLRYEVATGQVPSQETAAPAVRPRPLQIPRLPWIRILAVVVAAVVLFVLFLVLRPDSRGDGLSPASSTSAAVWSQTPESALPAVTSAPIGTSTPDATMPRVMAPLDSSTALAAKASPAATSSPVPSREPTAPCRYPAEWLAYEVKTGDTLRELALKHGITVAEVMEGNCLTGRVVSSGQILFLPPLQLALPTPGVTATESVAPTTELSPTGCIPPEGWTVLHVVEVGDNLYSLGLTYGVPVDEIMAANCLESTFLSAGRQQLYLPPPAPRLNPSPTDSPELTNRSFDNPTVTVDSTNTVLPGPVLVSPADRSEFAASAKVVLQWRPVQGLPPDGYYAVSVAYYHFGQTWYDEVPWTQSTEWTLSDHGYLLDLSDNGEFRWSVQVVRQTGVDGDGRPVSLPLSTPSGVRTLFWRRPSEGGGGTGTPAVPPP